MKKQDENFYDFLEKIDKVVKTVLVVALILFGYAVLETILNVIASKLSCERVKITYTLDQIYLNTV